MKTLMLFFSIFVSISMSAQVELTAVKGKFEHLVPWGDGYLGVVQTQKLIIMPKYRQFQYFDKEGQMLWNHKVTPYNFQNESLCHSESEYAYFVNMPFSKTAFQERQNNDNFLNLYQMDRAGNLVEKQLTFEDVSKELAEKSKDFYCEFIGVYKDGIVMVGATDQSSVYVIRIRNDFKVDVHYFPIDWDEKLWKAQKFSKEKIVLGEDEISVITARLEGIKLDMTIHSINLTDFSEVKEVRNTLDITGYQPIGRLGRVIDSSLNKEVFLEYSYVRRYGYTELTVYTLGSFMEYHYSPSGLEVCVYYLNLVVTSFNKVEKEGYLLYRLNPQEEASAELIQDFKFEIDNKVSGIHSFHWSNDGQFYALSQGPTDEIVVYSLNGKTQKFSKKLNFMEALLCYVTGETREKLVDIETVYFLKYERVYIEFTGPKNGYRNTATGLVYTY